MGARHLRPLSSLLLFFMIKATRCFARHALSHRYTHSHPAPPQARPAPLRCSVLMCGRSENVRKCLSKLAFAAAFLAALIIVPQKQLFDTCLRSFVKKSAAGSVILPVTLFGHGVRQSGFAKKCSGFSRFTRQSVKADARGDLRGRLRSGMRVQYQKQ